VQIQRGQSTIPGKTNLKNTAKTAQAKGIDEK
jgi:hypothetical protein